MDQRTADLNARLRVAFRLVGIVMVPIGIVVGLIGVIVFISEFGSDANGVIPLAMAVGGGFVAAIGGNLLRLGYLSVGVNYVVGESSGGIRTAADQVVGAIRSGPPQPSGVGPFCSQCGARVGADARFCSSCGIEIGAGG